MAWIKLDPITRRRFVRFRQIKRGYYSFLILMVAIVLSVFCEIYGSHASAPELTLDVILVGKGFFEAVEHASAPF